MKTQPRFEFTLPITPTPKGRPRLGRSGHVITPQRTRTAENEIRLLASPYAPRTPLEGAVRLFVVFGMERRKNRSQPIGEPHISRPDVDNLLKMIKDAFNGLFWVDDSQVAIVRAEKRYAEAPCIWVSIEEVPG